LIIIVTGYRNEVAGRKAARIKKAARHTQGGLCRKENGPDSLELSGPLLCTGARREVARR
jgi:hypothetical protein